MDYEEIPIIIDVARNIDGHDMVRCSYFSIETDEPLPNWRLELDHFSAPILLLNLEAIILGPPNDKKNFEEHSDIDSMYDFIEKDGGHMFIDINDIWVPIDWFGNVEIVQGKVFRILTEDFTKCWKFRNDKISLDEFLSFEEQMIERVEKRITQKPRVGFSEVESKVFNQWTGLQIEKSKASYMESNVRLKKIKQ